MQNDTVIAANL